MRGRLLRIKNPYTKDKVYIKGKFLRKFGRAIIELGSKIPKNKDNYYIKLLKEPRYILDVDLTKPDIIMDFTLDTVVFSDIVFVEDYKRLKKGLHKLYKHGSKSFYFDPFEIDKFFKSLNTELTYGRWSRLFSFKVSDKRLTEYCKEISISISSTTFSFVTIYFEIAPSDQFLNKLQTLINNDTDKRYIILKNPRYIKDILNIFKWSYVTYNKGTYKVSVIEDIFLELKWRIVKYLSEELPLFFSKLGFINPSIEIYKIKKNQDWLKKRHIPYEAIGINKNRFNEINSMGDIEIFYNEPDEFLKDLSLKILFNKVGFDKIKSNFDFDTHVAFKSEGVSFGLLELLSIYNLTKIFEERTLKHKNNYDHINSRKLMKLIKFSKLTDLRIKMERDYLYINRIKRDISDSLYKSFVENYKSIFGDMSNEWGIENIPVMLTTTVKRKLTNLTSLFENVKSELDNQMDFLNTIIDYKRQRRMLTLSILSLIIAIIALIVSILSI
jgi:hypothetical protein